VTLVYLDPAGTGDSDPLPDGDYSMSRYARFAAAVLDDLDASTGYFLGHSHGGFVGLQLGIDHPERLSGLILYDTAPVYGPELTETATKEMAAFVRRWPDRPEAAEAGRMWGCLAVTDGAGDRGRDEIRSSQPSSLRHSVDEGRTFMRLLLTSAGISNPSIHNTLVDLLGKPISESRALFVPTGIYPFPGGPGKAFEAITGKAKGPLCDLGWKSLGVLELTALPSIDREVWTATVREADALLVWGGDPVYLAYWMKHSGLAELFPSLPETVYVGVSAGSIAMASRFGESYFHAPACSGERLSSEDLVFVRPEGEITTTLVMAQGAGLVDFAIIPHVEYDDHHDVANAERWASRLPVPTYAIDDDTAIKVTDGTVEVVSEGHWKLLNP